MNSNASHSASGVNVRSSDRVMPNDELKDEDSPHPSVCMPPCHWKVPVILQVQVRNAAMFSVNKESRQIASQFTITRAFSPITDILYIPKSENASHSQAERSLGVGGEHPPPRNTSSTASDTLGRNFAAKLQVTEEPLRRLSNLPR